MKIQSINHNNSGFKASINKNTPEMDLAISYMEKCKDNEFPYANTKTELELFGLIEKALEKHPSKEVLNIGRILDNRFFWNERATISSNRAKFVDVEPIRDDSIGGELGIIRRILDPANKDMFNRLMGLEFAGKYDKWWGKNIAPIWPQVNDLYRENPKIEPNITDQQYNTCFRKQIDIYSSPFLNRPSKPQSEEVIKVNNKESSNIGYYCLAAIFATAILIGCLMPSKKAIQEQQTKIATSIKDSLNKISNDTIDLTKKFIK